MALQIADWWPIVVVIGVIWTLVVLVFAAARKDWSPGELWAWGFLLIVVAAFLSLVASGAIRP